MFTVVVPPIVTAPAVAVAKIPSEPDAVMFALVVTVVPVIAIPPLADRATVTETTPVAGIEIVPPFVVVIELETVTAAPLIVTGPATAIVPPVIVTPEVFPVFPIRKLDGGPARVKLVVLNVALNEALLDSNTTAPVVFTKIVGVPFSLSPTTVMFPVEAVAPARAPRLYVPIITTPLAPPSIVIFPPLAKMSDEPPK